MARSEIVEVAEAGVHWYSLHMWQMTYGFMAVHHSSGEPYYAETSTQLLPSSRGRGVHRARFEG